MTTCTRIMTNIRRDKSQLCASNLKMFFMAMPSDSPLMPPPSTQATNSSKDNVPSPFLSMSDINWSTAAEVNVFGSRAPSTVPNSYRSMEPSPFRSNFLNVCMSLHPMSIGSSWPSSAASLSDACSLNASSLMYSSPSGIKGAVISRPAIWLNKFPVTFCLKNLCPLISSQPVCPEPKRFSTVFVRRPVMSFLPAESLYLEGIVKASSITEARMEGTSSASAPNGTLPQTSSNMMTPRDQVSHSVA
mmetsp:Transcript_115335/g.322396  ORF Transcript_115335/g.322396 Transcript_115335/m.322396 type:complete len:246 (+) Transcript_115335:15-752(+)